MNSSINGIDWWLLHKIRHRYPFYAGRAMGKCHFHFVNSSPPGAAYTIQWIGLALVQIMTRSRTLLLIGPLRTHLSEILTKMQTFRSWKCIWIYRLRNGAILPRGELLMGWHFVGLTYTYYIHIYVLTCTRLITIESLRSRQYNFSSDSQLLV